MQQERRRFFRIEDNVGLKLTTIEPGQQESRIQQFWNEQHQFSLRNEFNYRLEQHQSDLLVIKNKMPELGRYLSLLQQQLDLLTDKVINDQDDFIDFEASVNLSAQGISLHSEQPYSAGQLVELHIQLLPNQQKIVTLGTVIESINPSGNKLFNLSLDFTHIHEADQELLVKHIHARQLLALSESRASDS